ncbi:phage tail protein [Novispirillum sp. DQ9]|uniref:phage tail protein n=1 Tax=Novispirillum sp. DQ9 TaxID=3398612 RepID=UPI003C7C2613
MDYFCGMIAVFGFSWAPSDFAACDGSTLPPMQYQMLYSLIANLYGGSGTSSMGLPDLRGRVAVGQGIYGGQTNFPLASKAGAVSTTLTTLNMPSHNHGASFTGTGGGGGGATILQASTDAAESAAPTSGSVLAGFQPASTGPTQFKAYRQTAPTATVALGGVSGGGITGGAVALGSTGQGAAFSNMQPFLTMNPCICLQGVYPMRPN